MSSISQTDFKDAKRWMPDGQIAKTKINMHWLLFDGNCLRSSN